jgi:glutamyl-tRNA synthetase
MQQAGYTADLETLVKIAPLIRERLTTLDEAPEWIGFFFGDEVQPSAAELLGGKLAAPVALQAAQRAAEVLEGLPAFDHETAEPPLRALAEELGLQAGQFFGLLRMALTGQKVSPPLFESMAIIGREKTLARLRRAAQLLADEA